MSETWQAISSSTLRSWLVGEHELAVLDAREQGVFCKEHLFHAACVPYSRVELDLQRLVPRLDVRLVWVDDGACDLAERAAARSVALGYSNVGVLDGGTAAWAKGGGELYSGVNVPSKAFGEYVEHTYDTPRVPATELSRLIESGANIVVLDSRPVGEYRRMSIPTGIACPGAELVHRAVGVAPDPATMVVVNCAGRTRSIIGAQSLINAGLPNTVVALENGTMGWELAGFQVERDQTRFADDPSHETRSWAVSAADGVRQKFGVASINMDTLADWLADPSRTTYVLDVRTPEEFARGTVPGARSAPGGQLVQATDEYVCVRNSRIVLVDDDGVRATMTASWLRQLGYGDAVVLADAPVGADDVSGVEIVSVKNLERWPDVATTSTGDLRDSLAEAGVVVLDLATSLDYRSKGHIPGAWWAVRSRLGEAADSLIDATDCSTLVIASFDDEFSYHAFDDVAEAFPQSSVSVLEGGTRAWIERGYPLELGFERATSTPDDIWYKPYDLAGDVAPTEDMQAYLTWEVALVEQLERDATVSFPAFG